MSLTHHRNQGLLLCHYCGYAESLPRICPRCKSEEIERLGIGTEKVEECIRQVFPDARIKRVDRDTISRRGAIEDLVHRLAKREVDILIGTQMVAKGHDFPGVTLVGVLLADMGLNMPDFRCAERTFQLITQVSGRAGRGDEPGKVIVQTFNPEHPSIRLAQQHDFHAFYECEAAIRLAQQHDFHAFYECEAAIRRELAYPPFGWLIALRFEGADFEKTQAVAEEIGQACRQIVDSHSFPGVVFLGPAPAPVERIKQRFRWQMLFKGIDRRYLHAFLWELVRIELPHRQKSGVKISIDTDPIHML